MGGEVKKYFEETERYKEFIKINDELIQINEQICQLIPEEQIQEEEELELLKKKLQKQLMRKRAKE